jgi:heat shock protein HtpX
MYAEIAGNKRKTIVLISLFTVVIIGLGWVLGQYYGEPNFGIVVATVVSTVMTLVGYFKGDAVALAASGAKPIERTQMPDLYNLVENLSIAAGMPMPKVYAIDDPSPNAFATGRDPEHASIVVTTGLMRILDRGELEGVLAHELSHIKNYDIRVMTLVVVLVGSIMLLSDWAMRTFLYGRRGRDRGGEASGILFLVGIVLAILSPLLAELIKLAVSRSREYLADASGALLTRYPDGLANALEKIARIDQPLRQANHATAHLFLANPFDPHVTHKRFERWFSTHPPILERVAKLRAMGR